MGRTTGSDWLDRYSAGEYEAVWAEMLQLGEALVSAPAYEHARAVAEETMRRARANVELLIERLRAAGYEFQYPEAVHVRPTDAEIAGLDTLEGELGPLPLSPTTTSPYRMQRPTLANGGFRGKIECEGENCWKVEPGLELTRTLAVGLTPM